MKILLRTWIRRPVISSWILAWFVLDFCQSQMSDVNTACLLKVNKAALLWRTCIFHQKREVKSFYTLVVKVVASYITCTCMVWQPLWSWICGCGNESNVLRQKVPFQSLTSDWVEVARFLFVLFWGQNDLISSCRASNCRLLLTFFIPLNVLGNGNELMLL